MKPNEKIYLALLNRSFPGIRDNIVRWEALGLTWEMSRAFVKEENGEVVSHVGLLEFPVVIDGHWLKIGALHAVCTEASYRGRGLASELVRDALQVASGLFDTVILFTAISSFFEQLEFRRIQEQRFYLALPHPKGTQSLRSLTAPSDHGLLMRCYRDCEPLSNRVWLKDNGAVASFNALFATFPAYWSFYHLPAMDGLVSCELKDGKLHLYDVVARKMPSLALILDHLPASIDGIYFYFSPDKLAPDSIAEPYVFDNGQLMVHGAWPSTGHFMISTLSRC